MASSPIPRTRVIEKRESTLRASILDTALELGVGSSRTVANWIFNPVEEEDEDAESNISPSLTYASTATSEEFSLSPSFAFDRARPGAGQSGLAKSQDRSAGSPLQYSRSDGILSRGLIPEPSSQRMIQFDLSSTPEPRVPSPIPPSSKLRKLRKPKPDGYESDGGYVSDGGKGDKQKKEKKSKKKGGNEDETDGGYLSDMLGRRKTKKDKKKVSELPAIDNETDAGYVSTTSAARGKKKKASKSSVVSPIAGEESDAGNMSESSTKRRRFFRLNTKSRKRQDPSDVSLPEVIPPVPSLPPMPLPIAERFIRSETPSISEQSRTTTPTISERTAPQRSSDDASFLDTGSVSSPLDSPRALTKAFGDARSIRTPSTDVLRAFGRQVGLHALKSPGAPTGSAPQSREGLDPTEAYYSMSTLSNGNVPMMGMPKPKRNFSQKRTPAHASAPNARALSARPRPIPMMLTPPTPLPDMSSVRASPRSPSSDAAFPPTPQSVHSSSSYFDSLTEGGEDAMPSPLPSPALPSSPIASPMALARPNALGKYDLPPPSPPPMGPLPQVPPSPSMSISPDSRTAQSYVRRPGTADNDQLPPPSPLTQRRLRPGTAPSDTAPSTFRSVSNGNLKGRPGTAPSSAPTVIRSESSPSIDSTPLFLRRIPSIQRGRESPFPSRPVLTPDASADLVRRTSPARPGARPSPIDSDEPPLSADAIHRGDQRKQLGVNWQPRSASALETRQYDDEDNIDSHSWVDFESANSSARTSARSSIESHPDIESVLSALQDGEDGDERDSQDFSDLYTSRSREEMEDDDDRSRYPDEERSTAGRSTRYFDVDGNSDAEGDNRYSMWSEGDGRSRISILDDERSGNARVRFMKRVEEMYSKEGIERGLVPPVPALPPSGRNQAK